MGSDTRTILDGVDLDIAAGETVVVTGHSGSGKSTLLAIAGLLMSPDVGTVTIAGTPATGLSKKQATKVRRDHVGIIYQASNLFPALTCREQLERSLTHSNSYQPTCDGSTSARLDSTLR